jgi:hypothetical protein
MYNPLTENINKEKIAADYKGDLKKAVPTIDVAFVGKLLSDVFGVESPIYLPTWWQGREFKAGSYSDVKLMEEEPDYINAPFRMGNRVFGAFWISEGSYKKYEFDGSLKSYRYSEFLMPVATIVDFSRPKTVVKTPTIGGMGSVKEIYALEDWNITINGIILPDENNPPAFRTVRGQMDAIQKFHEIAGSIGVEGQIFAERNIARIVTENLTFTPIQGKPNMMQYSIEAVSDEDLITMV